MEDRYQEFIFDADTHMSPYHNFDSSIDAEEWERRMDQSGISRGLVWLLPQGVEDVSESNAYIYREAKKNKRMVPFGWANVREGTQKAKEDARKCLEDYGFAGVKLNGAQNEYYIDSPEAMEVLQVIADLGGITAFHIGADYPEYTNPRRAQNVAQRFPHMPVLMVHMGGAGEPDVSEDVIRTAAQNPNMYLVGSAIPVDKVKRAIDVLGAERVLFGSDAPFADTAAVLSEYRKMLAGYDDEVGRMVLGLNARSLFRL